MSLLTKVKKVAGKIMGKKEMVQNAEQEESDRELIEKWQPVFEADKRAKKPWDARFDEWEAIYDAGRDFQNVEDEFSNSNRTMRTNINFPRMIIESLIELRVPDPDFQAISKDDEESIEKLKQYVMYVVRSAQPSLEEINLHNERRVMKFGGAFHKIHWNNSVKRAGYVGEIEISMPHPKDIIPNHGATSIDDMEHYHHPNNRTANYITRKWQDITKEMLEQKAQLFHEYDEMSGSQRINVGDSESGDQEMGLEKYTIIETSYKDDDGDICKFWWSGDLVIKHIPKFYHRRDEDGTSIKASHEYEGKEADYYIPKSWDLIYQPFIPRDKSFWGISIMEDIHDINEAIKKAVYQHEEEHLKGNIQLLVGSQELKIALESSISKVHYVQDPNQNVKEINMRGNVDGVAWINQLKEWMQLLTGATNSALGVRDQGVTSGKQAQVYVEQANFKVALKSAYKASAYKRIYRTIADFALAFVDEERPFRIKGEPPAPPMPNAPTAPTMPGQPPAPTPMVDPNATKPKAQYGKFDRLAMLKDQSGNYIYPDFDIEISAESGFMKSRVEIFNTLSNLAGQGRFEPNPGNLTFLKLLNKLGVPDLQGVIDEMGEIIKQSQAAPPKQEIPKPPTESIPFKDLPPSGQIQMAAKAGIQLTVEDIQQMQAMLQAQNQGKQPQVPPQAPQSPDGKQQPQGKPKLSPEIMKALEKLPEPVSRLLMQMEPYKLMVLLDNPNELMAVVEQIMAEAQGGQ